MAWVLPGAAAAANGGEYRAPDPRRPGCGLTVYHGGMWRNHAMQEGSGPIAFRAFGHDLPSLIAYLYGIDARAACDGLEQMVELLEQVRAALPGYDR